MPSTDSTVQRQTGPSSDKVFMSTGEVRLTHSRSSDQHVSKGANLLNHTFPYDSGVWRAELHIQMGLCSDIFSAQTLKLDAYS